MKTRNCVFSHQGWAATVTKKSKEKEHEKMKHKPQKKSKKKHKKLTKNEKNQKGPMKRLKDSRNLAKNMYKLEKDKATFYFPSEEWVLLAASTKELEEREFVVDSGASMHAAELETMRTSRSPTMVMTANGEVQTREEGTVYVKELDLFMTVVLLEEIPTVLSLGKLCADHGYISLDQRSKATTHQKGQEN